MHVMEHKYVTKGLTETALNTLWVVLTKHFFAVNVFCKLISSRAETCNVLLRTILLLQCITAFFLLIAKLHERLTLNSLQKHLVKTIQRVVSVVSVSPCCKIYHVPLCVVCKK